MTIFKESAVDVQQMEHRSAERLANLLTLSYEPMLAWRLDGAIEFWNAGAERLNGFPPENVSASDRSGSPATLKSAS
jgi:PAS domain-containing protein